MRRVKGETEWSYPDDRPLAETMSVEMALTEADYGAWMEFVLDGDRQIQESQKGIRVVVPIITALVGLLAGGVVVGAVFLVAGLLMSWLFVPWALARQFARRIATYIADLPAGMIGAHTLELSDHTIRWTTAAVDATWQRSAIRQVAETDDHFFIMFAKNSALIVPRAPDPDGARLSLISRLQATG